MFGEGISRASEIIDLGVEYGIIQKSGAWFSYDGSKLAQGRDQAKRVIQDNPELAEELEEKIMEALQNAPVGGKKAAAKSKGSKPAAEAPSKPASSDARDEDTDELDELDFDGDLPDDFSIEED